MRKVTVPAPKWNEIDGARVSIPIIVDWPELQLTLDQITANAVARANDKPEPFPDHSMFCIEIERPRGQGDVDVD